MLKDKIIEIIENMNDSDLLYLHNEYCNATNSFDDEIIEIDNIDDLISNQDFYWIACRVCYGDFHPNADYIKFDGYGNFQSIFSTELLEYIYIDDIVDYIITNNDALYNDEIQDILNEFEIIEKQDTLEKEYNKTMD